MVDVFDREDMEDSEAFAFPNGVPIPPVHPGRSLASELSARGLAANALALKLRVPSNRLSEIIRGQRGISSETALRLGRYFGTGAAFWMNLQSQYDLAVAEQELVGQLPRHVPYCGKLAGEVSDVPAAEGSTPRIG